MSITPARLINCKPILDSRVFKPIATQSKTYFLFQHIYTFYRCTFASFMISVSPFVIVTGTVTRGQAESRSQWSARQGSGCTITEVPIWRGWPYPVYSLATGQPQTYWRLPRINPTTHWDKLPSLESRRCNKLNKEDSLIQRFQMKVKIKRRRMH